MQDRKRAKVKLRDSCDACSEAKIKCNKDKPVCSRCKVKGLNCYYGPSNRSGRRSTVASKASERARKSATPGPEPVPAQVAMPVSQPAVTSIEFDSTATLDAVSGADFNFTADAFDFPDMSLDGTSSGMTPFTMFPEPPSKMDVSAPEYDVAALMSTNPSSPMDHNRKHTRENSNSRSNDSMSYDNRNDSIGSGLDNLTYDSQWFNNPALTFSNNFKTGPNMPAGGTYTPQMTLPDNSTPSSLQSSIFNHQPFPIPNSHAIFSSPPPKTSCTCLTQALSLLAALHDDTRSSSTSPTPPVIGTLTPPYSEIDSNNTTSFRNIAGGSMGIKSAGTGTIHECLSLNTSSLQQATTILNCECSSNNQQLVFFVAFIALKTMDRYTAAAHGSDTLDHISGCGDKGDSRARAQLVLGELHRVVRIVDTISKRMRECRSRRGSDSSTSLNKGGFGKGFDFGVDGTQGGPGGCDISASCFTQLEDDLRKNLRAVTNDTMAILRSE